MSSPRPVETGFLALLDARIALQETGVLQRDAEIGIMQQQCLADPKPHRLRLSPLTAPPDFHLDVKCGLEIGDRERSNRRPDEFAVEIRLQTATVDLHVALAVGMETHIRDGTLSLPGGGVVRCRHTMGRGRNA